MPKIKVYLSLIPDKKIEKVLPKERFDEINGCLDEKVKREKYFVWKLLELALRNATGVNPDFTRFYKGVNGKWQAQGVEFSLSHSNGVVAVAISDKPVGIDLQVIKPLKNDRLIEKIFTEKELEKINALSGQEKTARIIEKWAEKESDFKRVGGDNFLTYIRDNRAVSGFSARVTLPNGDYVVAVSGEGEVEMKIVEL